MSNKVIKDITTCKVVHNPFTDSIMYEVNGSILVPECETNADYKEVQKWKDKGNVPLPKYTSEELVKMKANFKRAEANAIATRYLESTDWVVTKINEYQLMGEDTTELLTKYADILQKRKEARDAIR